MSDWHDYFMLIGGAAATLIGAMFVVVSIGSGFLTPERASGIRNAWDMIIFFVTRDRTPG